MTTQHQAFGAFLREQVDTNLDTMMQDITRIGPTYAQEEAAREKVRASFLVIAEAIEQNDMPGLVKASQDIGLDRARSGFGIQEVLNSFEILRNHIWRLLQDFLQDRAPWSLQEIQQLEDFMHTFLLNVATSFGNLLEQTRSEMEEQSDRLEAQSRTIRELGTPIMPVHEGVLVLPLVGVLDSYRASQVMEKLLEAIAGYQADLVIMDITGVPVVDTSVANYILQAARAAKLVGARVILVGIGAEIAQTMVHLGVDMSDIITLANLQEGIQYAFEQLGISMVHHDGGMPESVTPMHMV